MGIPAMVGAAAGAALNRKNPLQGALLGGALGGFGGSIYSGAQELAGAKLAAAAPSATSNLAGAGGSGMFTAGTIPTAGSSAYMPTVSTSMAGNALNPVGYSTVASPAVNAPTFMQTMSQVPSAISQSFDDIGQYAQKNPVLVATAAQTGQSLLQQPDRQLPPSGLIRGTPSQVAAPQYQVGIPKVSLI